MKIGLTFKTPDALDSAIADILAEGDMVGDSEETYELQERARSVLSNYVKYGEYVSIEVDIETGEAVVCRTR